MASTLTPEGIQAFLGTVGVEGELMQFPLADVGTSPMAIYLSFLAGILVQLTGCDQNAAWDAIQRSNDLGDLAVVVPRLRLQGAKPAELAVQLQQTFPTNPLFEHPFHDDINLRFYLNPSMLSRLLLRYIIDRGRDYGMDTSAGLRRHDDPGSGRKKVIVEFSSPNIGREFDENHLRSTIVGMFVASLYESMGWDVVRMNFLGDWGKHIGLLDVGWPKFGSDKLFEDDPLAHLLHVYSEINGLLQVEKKDPSAGTRIDEEKDEFFKKLEDRDPDAISLWRRFRDASVASYKASYARLNLAFDEYSGESDFSPETVAGIEAALKEKDAYHESEEAWIVDFAQLNIKGLPNGIARFRNGTTSYLLRDIVAFVERSKKHSFDRMIYVVSSRQDSHFSQLSKALELLGETNLDERLKHLSFGRLQGLSPSPGSSGLLLSDVLDQWRDGAQKLLDTEHEALPEFPQHDAKVADALGVSSLVIQDLSHRHNTQISVDVGRMAANDAHSGIALQQWHAALSAKLSGAAAVDQEALDAADYSVFANEAYADVLRVLIQFPDIVKAAFRSATLESSTIVTYLFRVTTAVAAVWDEDDADGEAEGSNSSPHSNVAKLALYEAVRQVLENGMRVLGIVPLAL